MFKEKFAGITMAAGTAAGVVLGKISDLIEITLDKAESGIERAEFLADLTRGENKIRRTNPSVYDGLPSYLKDVADVRGLTIADLQFALDEAVRRIAEQRKKDEAAAQEGGPASA